MNDFVLKERGCEIAFMELGECYHLWTPENFEIIFTCDDDFKIGMSVIGICARLFPDVRIITFEVMSNHLHITASGDLRRIQDFFLAVKEKLNRSFSTKGRKICWDGFTAKHRLLSELQDLRNVIAYDNRNGFVVSNRYTPFTYPWGANRYYFNPDAKARALEHATPMTVRRLREVSHTKTNDGIKDLLTFEDCALPLSFCDIEAGERLFRDPPHYFNRISKSIESNAVIAKEIGESVYYTDDELYDTVARICSRKYGDAVPSRLPPQAKIEVAKTMSYDYNASAKQIQRMLKLDPAILKSLGIR